MLNLVILEAQFLGQSKLPQKLESPFLRVCLICMMSHVGSTTIYAQNACLEKLYKETLGRAGSLELTPYLSSSISLVLTLLFIQGLLAVLPPLALGRHHSVLCQGPETLTGSYTFARNIIKPIPVCVATSTCLRLGYQLVPGQSASNLPETPGCYHMLHRKSRETILKSRKI